MGKGRVQEDLDDLRRLILSIALTYEDGNPDFKDVSEDFNIESIKCFNEEDE